MIIRVMENLLERKVSTALSGLRSCIGNQEMKRNRVKTSNILVLRSLSVFPTSFLGFHVPLVQP